MSFLEKYIETSSKVRGVPNLEMNAPLVTNSLGHVGLELEIEGRRLPTEGHLERIKSPISKAWWSSHPDGSLRGENQEYVLTTPCFVDEVDDMLSGLYEKFQELGSALNLSNRCSTHVHVNMAGKKINQLTSILALWTTYEEVLVNWCGEERKANHFCLSGKDTTSMISSWYSFLRTGHLRLSEGMKYSALNLRTLYNIGSFEFRCMSASEDKSVISDWTKFVHGLCEFASEEFADPRLMAPALSERGSIELFADICRKAKTSEKFFEAVIHHEENSHFEKKVMEGFRRAQGLVFGFPWQEWLEEINKVFVPSPFGALKKKGTRADPFAELDEIWADPYERRRGLDLNRAGGIFRAAPPQQPVADNLENRRDEFARVVREERARQELERARARLAAAQWINIGNNDNG